MRDQKNKRHKSVHAGHAASKSCVPNSKTGCTGHAGTLYFRPGYTATTLGSCTLACLYLDSMFRCVRVSLCCLVMSYGLPSPLS